MASITDVRASFDDRAFTANRRQRRANMAGRIIGTLLGLLIAAFLIWVQVMFMIWLFHVAPILFWILVGFIGLSLISGLIGGIASAL